MKEKGKTFLLINNREIEVLAYDFDFNKNIDTSGKPTNSTEFTGLDIDIESTQNTDLEEWASRENSIKQIELKIYYPYLKGGSKTMTFFDCYLTKFETIFSANDNKSMLDRLTIKCAGVKMPNSSLEYSSYWRKTSSNTSGDKSNNKTTSNSSTNFSVTPKLS
ncbi:type VI secretion system tube protein TssD [Tenacibaculum sp.]|uniref:type VI secretion system tube protein TssD n=1 Tax=Tenacibaculum sp. TaxID=1906242 RepID=UPI003D10543A